MFLKSKTIDFNISINVKWKCPHCSKAHTTEYNGSPYTAIAEDPADVDCDGCGEFITLNFYANED